MISTATHSTQLIILFFQKICSVETGINEEFTPKAMKITDMRAPRLKASPRNGGAVPWFPK
jgi:hypothetical protein